MSVPLLGERRRFCVGECMSGNTLFIYTYMYIHNTYAYTHLHTFIFTYIHAYIYIYAIRLYTQEHEKQRSVQICVTYIHTHIITRKAEDKIREDGETIVALKLQLAAIKERLDHSTKMNVTLEKEVYFHVCTRAC